MTQSGVVKVHTLGSLLAELRKNNERSPAAFAFWLGLTWAEIRLIEMGKVSITADRAEHIAVKLGQSRVLFVRLAHEQWQRSGVLRLRERRSVMTERKDERS